MNEEKNMLRNKLKIVEDKLLKIVEDKLNKANNDIDKKNLIMN